MGNFKIEHHETCTTWRMRLSTRNSRLRPEWCTTVRSLITFSYWGIHSFTSPLSTMANTTEESRFWMEDILVVEIDFEMTTTGKGTVETTSTFLTMEQEPSTLNFPSFQLINSIILKHNFLRIFERINFSNYLWRDERSNCMDTNSDLKSKRLLD